MSDALGNIQDPYEPLEDYEWEIPCEFGEDPIEEHFEAISHLNKYTWVDGDGITVDLRYISRKRQIYAGNILKWMEEHDSFNTPYKHSEQFQYLSERMKSFNNKCEQIRRMFRHEF